MKQPSFPSLKQPGFLVVSVQALLVAVLAAALGWPKTEVPANTSHELKLSAKPPTTSSLPPDTGKPQRITDSEAVPQGLGTSDWTTIKAAYQAGRRKVFERAPRQLVARSDSQQYRAEFDGRGFQLQPNVGKWRWGLELTGYGVAGAETSLKQQQPAVTHAGERVAYAWDGRLEEWFVNGPAGLEQGWTLTSPPADLESGRLHLDLAVQGELVPRAGTDPASVSFADKTGVAVLTYGGLKAWDANGKAVPAWFEPVAGKARALRVGVETAGAAYPITIDPVVQQAYLKASNTDAVDLFGFSVAVSSDTVVIGAPNESSNATGINGNQADNSAANSGAAYVFVRSGGVWSQQAYLKASNTGASDQFGWSVGVSGDTVVVGAQSEASNATGVNGNQADNSAANSGAAYVFVRSGGVWSQQAYLKASNTQANDFFGYSVAVSGDTVVVGAYREGSNATGVNGNQADNSATGAGAAYVFFRTGTTWSQQAYLKASNTQAFDQFGYSVAVSGNTAVVGSILEDSAATGVNGNQADNTADASGAAYVFVRSGAVWSQQAYLKASNTETLDFFGYSVAVDVDTVVVGVYQEDSGATGVNGNGADNSAADAGAAYVFFRSGTTWSQQAYLKASNTAAGDHFGISVGVSGNTVVVGARWEDSGATGVNGNQADNTATSAGAVYMFVRSGAVWSQQAYLKASNTGSGDNFGYSVAVSGDTTVVGAVQEDSNATGVNGNQADNSVSGAGAAYVFVVLPPTVASINRTGGASVCNGTASVSWTVTFSDPETGVAASNFSLVNSGLTGPSITSVIGSGTTWTVTASTGTGNGMLGLNLVNSTGVTPTLTSLPFTGEVYTVLPAVTVNPATLPDGVTGTAYSQNLSASGTGPFTFAQTGGALPSGLTLSSGGVLSGNPTVSGNYSFTVTATGAGSCTGSQAYTVNITRQLNASATVSVMGTSSNMTPSTGFIGDYTITTTLQNTGGVPLNGPMYFRVMQLQAGGNTYRLKTADDFVAATPSGGLTGSRQTVTGGSLAPGGTRTVSFTVGIANTRVVFQLYVDLYAVNGTSPRADKVGSYSFTVNQKFGAGGGSFGTKLEVAPEAVSETAVIGGIGTQTSPVLAKHPTDVNRFAVAADDYLTRNVMVRWTDNGGASWRTQALSRVVNGREYFVANAPTLAYTPQGDLVAVYTLGNLEDSANALVVSHLGDRLTFTPPTALVEYSTGQRKFVGRSSLAVNSLGTPYAAWETVDTLNDNSSISVARALGTNLIQATVTSGTVSHPVLTVGPKDALYLGWQEWAAKQTDSGGEVRLAVSDSNLSFGPPQTIAATGIGYGRTIPAMPEEEVTANLSLVADPLQAGTLYAVFTQAGDGLDVVLSRSTDNGKTWSVPTPVSDVTSGDQFHGAVDISLKGNLAIGYRDTRHSLGNETVLVRLAQSGDGGRNFTHSLVSSVPSNDSRSNPNRDTTSNLGTRIGLKVVNGVPLVVWTDTRNGNEDIFLNKF